MPELEALERTQEEVGLVEPGLSAVPGKEEARALAGKSCARRSVRRGEVLVEAGRTFSAMYVVWSGRFMVQTTSPDGSSSISECGGGQVVGADGLLPGRYASTVQAAADSMVWVLQPAVIEILREWNPDFEPFVRCLHAHASCELDPDRAKAMQDELAEFLIRRIACAGYQSPDA